MSDGYNTKLGSKPKASVSIGDESVNLIKSETKRSKSKSKLIIILLTICIVIIAIIAILLVLFGVFDKKKDDSSTTVNCDDKCTKNYTIYIKSVFNHSENWSDQQKTNYLLNFHNTSLGQCIMKMNVTNHHELRPNPSCYLPPNIIQHHLNKFKQYGASAISNTKYAYKSNFTWIGRDADSFDTNGVQWVSPYQIQREILQNCSNEQDPANCVLTALGIPRSSWDMFHYNWLNESDIASNVSINRVMQIHIFAYDMNELHLRIPSGNEQGTDSSLWRPGGYTINGTAEAVVDRIEGSMDNQQYCWKPVTTVNGTWCYPNCEVICEDAPGCTQTAC